MLLALVGNQNCGKTTLFNQLTGSNQHVGNFPGVTIEHKIGQIIGWKNYDLVDLPGIYSIRPYSGEEKVSRDFIIERKPDAIINIVDATNIERNLYLTLQLIEMGCPTGWAYPLCRSQRPKTTALTSLCASLPKRRKMR